MSKQRLHTPDGVRDIYNGECRAKYRLRKALYGCMRRFGYQQIETPTFEFFDIFGNEVGTTPSKDLYKFFDKEGNTLVLRPDYTPAIARSAVKYYGVEDMPVKLCYVGNTFLNSSDYQGRLKETTQCGAELIGDDNIAADAEILAMVVEALTDAGLDEFQISVGHADIFSGLAEASALDEDQISHLHELIMNKNFFGVEEFVGGLSLEPELAKLFTMLGSFNIRDEELALAKKNAAGYPKILAAVRHLEELAAYMKDYGIDKFITFEPGLISDYRYYTGIIFAGFTFGSGEPVVRGGRYDKLLSYFGRDIPSIGFTIGIDQLLAVLTRQGISPDTRAEGILLVYRKNHAAEAFARARKLRQEHGEIVNMMAYDETGAPDYEEFARKKHLSRVEYCGPCPERNRR